MYTLGINATFHDSSACLVQDGTVLAAAEEERFTGIKHAKRPVPFSAYELPFHAIDYCLASQNIRLIDIDHVAYSFNPYLLLAGNQGAVIELPLRPSESVSASRWESVWDPLFLSYIVNAPRQLADGAPHHLKKRFTGATHQGPYQWHFIDHHLAHAASAYLPSPFDEAAIMTIDGRGEKSTTTYGIGKDRAVEIMQTVNMPNSLGILYERVTAYLGFLHSCDEYKVMALASFGQPRYKKEFQNIINLNGSGTYTLRKADFETLFGPGRSKGDDFEQKHYDIAHSLQQVLEETMLELAQWFHQRTHAENLCMAGGVALNCVMNSVLRDHGPFKKIWVQPASNDAGTALGAAMVVDSRERKSTRRSYQMEHAYLGPSFDDKEIEGFLNWSKLPFERMSRIDEEIADLLIHDRVVAWFQGRMEFGPRALGARSLLASPLHASMQAKLNEIKDREDFRPVAPVVIEEECKNWFADCAFSPFMLFVNKICEEKAEKIPAVCHIDGTARVQTINRNQNQKLYDLLKAFQSRSGVPVLINTSFNTRGKPIVCSPRDAVECFYTSPIDALAIGSFLLKKPGVS